MFDQLPSLFTGSGGFSGSSTAQSGASSDATIGDNVFRGNDINFASTNPIVYVAIGVVALIALVILKRK